MSARILVVDDNPVNVKLLSARLTHDYYVIITASNGVEAVEKAKSEQPDLILLDVMMPEMDGFEACRRIKTSLETKHIPIIMVTALSDTKDRISGLEAGADDFLTKPINEIALMARVRSLLRLKMTMDEWRMREGTAATFSAAEDGFPSKQAGEIQGASVLLVEKGSTDKALVVSTLSPAGITVDLASDINVALEEAKKGKHDLLLSGIGRSGMDGLRLCSELRASSATRSLPLLLLAEEDELPLVARGLDLGASDYILRPVEPHELLARTWTQIRQKRQYDCMKRNYEQSLSLALVDHLTGAFNRRYLDTHLPRMFERCKRSSHRLSILLLDIDHFKSINDEYGHPIGDAALREMAARVSALIRPFDLLARLGGEEFLIVMPDADLETAKMVAERLRSSLSASPIAASDDGKPITATASIGIASMTSGKDISAEEMIKRADSALYRAKNSGRNRIEWET